MPGESFNPQYCLVTIMYQNVMSFHQSAIKYHTVNGLTRLVYASATSKFTQKKARAAGTRYCGSMVHRLSIRPDRVYMRDTCSNTVFQHPRSSCELRIHPGPAESS